MERKGFFGSERHSVFVATTLSPLLFPHNLCPDSFTKELISLTIVFPGEREMVILTNFTGVIP